jgi:hypothetical protein
VALNFEMMCFFYEITGLHADEHGDGCILGC